MYLSCLQGCDFLVGTTMLLGLLQYLPWHRKIDICVNRMSATYMTSKFAAIHLLEVCAFLSRHPICGDNRRCEMRLLFQSCLRILLLFVTLLLCDDGTTVGLCLYLSRLLDFEDCGSNLKLWCTMIEPQHEILRNIYNILAFHYSIIVQWYSRN